MMSTTKTSIDFSHRLSYSKDDMLDSSVLRDTINLMTSRALSLLSMMSVLAEDHRMDSISDADWHTLFSNVSNELHDIDALLAASDKDEPVKESGETVNAAEQAPIESNDDAIKFTHAKDGKVSVETGLTSFNDLFTIGAFSLTGQTKFTGDEAYKDYPTDIAGLKKLQYKSGAAVDEITDVITSLGMMLAYVDRGNIGNKHLNNHAWLVAGLGELLSQLVHENQEITNSILAISKQS
jgi:hypothetical protein